MLARVCHPTPHQDQRGWRGLGNSGPGIWGPPFSELHDRILCDLPTARSASSLPLTVTRWAGGAAPHVPGTCTPFLKGLTKSGSLSTGESPALPLLFPCGTVKGEILPKMLKDRGDDCALACGHSPPLCPLRAAGSLCGPRSGLAPCGAPRGGWATPYGHLWCGVQAAVLTVARSPQGVTAFAKSMVVLVRTDPGAGPPTEDSLRREPSVHSGTKPVFCF